MADSLGVNLGVMIMVGIPTALICMIVAGVIWGRFIGNKVFTKLPVNVEEIKEDSKELPPFGLDAWSDSYTTCINTGKYCF